MVNVVITGTANIVAQIVWACKMSYAIPSCFSQREYCKRSGKCKWHTCLRDKPLKSIDFLCTGVFFQRVRQKKMANTGSGALGELCLEKELIFFCLCEEAQVPEKANMTYTYMQEVLGTNLG
jgi:hypothetical protein